MAKRKNLRDPDILPFDYVSVLLNWRTNTLASNNPTLTISKVLGGTIPFNANIISTIAVDNSSTISFVFQSPFDINTSPWQFEMEIAFFTGTAKFRPHAVYNGSNNQITVKFNVANLTATTSYPLVFTAKRYRPTAQYLAQLATASQNPVTIGTAGSITSNIAYAVAPNTTQSGGGTLGHYFQAPTNFVINSVSAPPAFVSNTVAPNSFFVRIISIPSIGASTFTQLFFDGGTGVSSVPVNLTINTNQIIGIFSSVFFSGPSQYSQFTINTGGVATTANIAGFNTTVTNVLGIGSTNIALFTNVAYGFNSIGLSTVNITTAGGTAWSNIIY